MDVKFGNKSINQTEVISPDEARGQMILSWGSQPDRLHTVGVYNLKTGALNYLAINIPGQDFSKGQELVQYQIPQSTVGDTPYAVVVYQQPPGRKVSQTSQPNLNTIVQQNGLTQVGSRIFSVRAATIPKIEHTVKQGPQVSQVEPAVLEEGSQDHSTWMKENPLNEKQQKWCRCTLQVAGKQPPACLIEEAWFQRRDGYKCANPYPVCAKSVGTTTRECSKYYNFNMLPNQELKGYAYLHKIPVPEPYNRAQLLQNITQWKTQKYGQ